MEAVGGEMSISYQYDDRYRIPRIENLFMFVSRMEQPIEKIDSRC